MRLFIYILCFVFTSFKMDTPVTPVDDCYYDVCVVPVDGDYRNVDVYVSRGFRGQPCVNTTQTFRVVILALDQQTIKLGTYITFGVGEIHKYVGRVSINDGNEGYSAQLYLDTNYLFSRYFNPEAPYGYYCP